MLANNFANFSLKHYGKYPVDKFFRNFPSQKMRIKWQLDGNNGRISYAA